MQLGLIASRLVLAAPYSNLFRIQSGSRWASITATMSSTSLPGE